MSETDPGPAPLEFGGALNSIGWPVELLAVPPLVQMDVATHAPGRRSWIFCAYGFEPMSPAMIVATRGPPDYVLAPEFLV